MFAVNNYRAQLITSQKSPMPQWSDVRNPSPPSLPLFSLSYVAIVVADYSLYILIHWRLCQLPRG